jgi:peroxiredoxin
MQIDLRRLVLVLPLLAATLVLLYMFALRPEVETDAGFANARLLDTPAAGGELKVGVREGELAPDFEISTPDGLRVRLSDLRGRPVLINFFALWCGSCLAEMPVVKDVHAERGVKSFTVLAVNTGESRERAMEFIDFIDAPFVYGLDFDLTVSDAYGVRGLPNTVYIDANGVVRAVYAGQANKRRLNIYLDAAFAAAQPSPQPVELRLVSNIPREHVLLVDARDPGRVVLTSRRLRCDASYCADRVAPELEAIGGVTSVQVRRTDEGVREIEVLLDASLTGHDEVVNAVVALLESLADPLYDTPLEVRLVTP